MRLIGTYAFERLRDALQGYVDYSDTTKENGSRVWSVSLFNLKFVALKPTRGAPSFKLYHIVNNMNVTTDELIGNITGNTSEETIPLDLDEVGGDGKYIKYISQKDGQVSASTASFDSILSSSSSNAPTSSAVKKYVDDKIKESEEEESEVAESYYVAYDKPQLLYEYQKKQARDNIGAITSSDINLDNYVTEEELLDFAKRNLNGSYGFFSGNSFDYLSKEEGNMSMAQGGAGIEVVNGGLYHVTIYMNIKPSTAYDSDPLLYVSINNVKHTPLSVRFDASNPDFQPISVSFDFVGDSTCSALFGLDYTSSSQPIAFNSVLIQIHRISNNPQDVTLDEYNKLYYGDNLSLTTLKTTQNEEDCRIVTVSHGKNPRIVSTKDFQIADTVVTESQYEAMEEAGTLVEGMRYVVVEDS